MEFTFILLVAGSFIMGSSSAGMLSDAKLSQTVSAIQQVTVGFHNMPDSKPWVKISAHNKSTYIYVYIQYKLWIAIIFWSTCVYKQRKHGPQSLEFGQLLEINNISTDCQWLPTASVQ